MWKRKLQIKILMPGANTKVPRYASEQPQKIMKLTSIHNCYAEHHARQNSSCYFYFVLQ